MGGIRTLVLVLGDQLDRGSSAFDGFDPACDVVWMAEVAGEAEHVWSTKPRIAMFLAAMRHFRKALEDEGIRLHGSALEDGDNTQSLEGELDRAIRALQPQRLIVTEPGEYRVRRMIEAVARTHDLPLDIREDRHFLCPLDTFRAHAKGRKQLRLEYFYREMRRRHDVLLDDGEPAGGAWNYDAENRGAFGREGPGALPAPLAFPPDRITRGVLGLVERRFAEHPGSLDRFDWPVTPADAAAALDDFIANRLPHFGDYQDAMWLGEPFLYHSRISAALNLKLLDPAVAVRAAEQAWRQGAAPLAAVEGFIRQILGWREYVRGVYWLYMPGYLERNALGADAPLPEFYWTADTDMACLRDAIGQTLAYGYAHHIQRLMVTGLFALLLGVDPKQVHEWYLAVYVDAVEWVELPNTLGMSQYGDGGIMGSKPYVASGAYIQRMSNACDACRYDPKQRTGEDACPFTTLYWDFLLRHRERFESHPRMKLQVRNADRLGAEETARIRRQADALRDALA